MVGTNFFVSRTNPDGNTEQVALANVDGDIVLATGLIKPTDASSGYSKGCIFLDTDATSGSVMFLNEGSKTSANFNPFATEIAAGDLAITGTLTTTDGMTSSGSTGTGIGYATGAGGAVTQITTRSTGVTLNKLAGTITTDTTSLAAEGTADFIVTNTTVAIGDVVVVSVQSGSNSGGTIVSVSTVAAGSFTVRVHNGNVAAGTAETGAIKINFAVIKAVSA